MITSAQWKRAVGLVLPASEDWRYRGKLAYLTPVDWVLLGILGEGSASNRDRVFVWTVAMPLFMPVDHLVLSWSERVDPAGTFSPAEEPAFGRAIARALSAMPSQKEALKLMTKRGSVRDEATRILKGSVTQDLREVRNVTAAALGVA